MSDGSIAKIKIGLVVVAKADKTVKVRISRMVKHSVYGKVVRKHKHYLVHDPSGVCRGKEGSFVRIKEIRPISLMKRWEVVDELVGGFGDSKE